MSTPVSRVLLRLSAAKLIQKDVSSPSDAYAIVFVKEADKTDKGEWVELARTEIVHNNSDPSWASPVDLVYKHGDPHPLKIVVWDHDDHKHDDYIGEAETTLDEVLAGTNAAQVLQLTEHGNIATKGRRGAVTLSCAELPGASESLCITFRCTGLDNKDWFSKSDPYIAICEPLEPERQAYANRAGELSAEVGKPHGGSTGRTRLWTSSVLMDNLNPTWPPALLPLTLLCGGDLDRPLVMECWDWNNVQAHELIGTSQPLSINDMLTLFDISKEQKGEEGKALETTATGLPLFNPLLLAKAGYKNSGILHIAAASILRPAELPATPAEEASSSSGSDETASNAAADNAAGSGAEGAAAAAPPAQPRPRPVASSSVELKKHLEAALVGKARAEREAASLKAQLEQESARAAAAEKAQEQAAVDAAAARSETEQAVRERRVATAEAEAQTRARDEAVTAKAAAEEAAERAKALADAAVYRAEEAGRAKEAAEQALARVQAELDALRAQLQADAVSRAEEQAAAQRALVERAQREVEEKERAEVEEAARKEAERQRLAARSVLLTDEEALARAQAEADAKAKWMAPKTVVLDLSASPAALQARNAGNGMSSPATRVLRSFAAGAAAYGFSSPVALSQSQRAAFGGPSTATWGGTSTGFTTSYMSSATSYGSGSGESREEGVHTTRGAADGPSSLIASGAVPPVHVPVPAVSGSQQAAPSAEDTHNAAAVPVLAEAVKDLTNALEVEQREVAAMRAAVERAEKQKMLTLAENRLLEARLASVAEAQQQRQQRQEAGREPGSLYSPPTTPEGRRSPVAAARSAGLPSTAPGPLAAVVPAPVQPFSPQELKAIERLNPSVAAQLARLQAECHGDVTGPSAAAARLRTFLASARGNPQAFASTLAKLPGATSTTPL